jgi:hypothetical protein
MALLLVNIMNIVDNIIDDMWKDMKGYERKPQRSKSCTILMSESKPGKDND